MNRAVLLDGSSGYCPCELPWPQDPEDGEHTDSPQTPRG